MSEYIIATASTADLPRDYLDAHHLPFISYSYVMDDKPYQDDCREETRQNIYEKMRQGTVLTTSQINTFAYHEFFKSLMDKGLDVIYMDMSREMSHSYVNAKEAAAQIRQEYPNQRFYDMDTLCISGGLGLLVENAVSLKEAGKSFDEVVAWCEDNKLKVMHRFTVDDLKYLQRSGRVSNASALIGSLLAVKPVMYVPDDGKLTVGSKVQGRKKALMAIVDGVKRDMAHPQGQIVHILNADCRQDAEFVAAKVKEAFPDVAEVRITNLGTIIGAHCGPGLLTIFYYGDHRQI